jgi:hypothetical protein
MAEVPALDAAELLAALSRHDVDCVLIGGMAIQAYGHVRTTVDLDVIAAWTPENMRRLAAALGELGARLRGVDADLLGIDLTDPEQLYGGGNFLMRTAHGDLDVFAVDQTAGAPRSYEQLRARAVAVEVLGARILIAHPEDLIRMKTAVSRFCDRPEAKRRQDLDDIAVLERLRADRDAASAARALEPTRSDRSEPGQRIQKPVSGRTPRTPRKPPQDRRRRH